MKHIAILFTASLCLFACAPKMVALDSHGVELPEVVIDEDNPPTRKQISEGYAILHDLMKQQSNVSLALLVHFESDAVESVIDEIASVSGEARGQIEKFAEDQPWIKLDKPNLPRMEIEARESITRMTKADLAPMKDDALRELMLSQVRATQYGSHLAWVLRAYEKDDVRRAYLHGLATRYERCRLRVVEVIEQEDY